MDMRSKLAVLIVFGALVLQQVAGQWHWGCRRGGHKGSHHGEDDKQTHRPADRRQDQEDPVPGNDEANGDGVPDITLDNRNFIFAPAFNAPDACPPGAVRITKTSPCRYPVRDNAPRAPVRAERGQCPAGMARAGQWCREPYG